MELRDLLAETPKGKSDSISLRLPGQTRRAMTPFVFLSTPSPPPRVISSRERQPTSQLLDNDKTSRMCHLPHRDHHHTPTHLAAKNCRSSNESESSRQPPRVVVHLQQHRYYVTRGEDSREEL